MAAPWTTYAGLVPPTCVVCCSQALDCECALFIPPLSGTVFSDLATAQTAIADYTGGCSIYLDQNNGVPSVFTVDTTTANQFEVIVAVPASSELCVISFCITVKDGVTIDLIFEAVGLTGGQFKSFSYELYSCDGTLLAVGSQSGVNPKTFTPAALAAGTYAIRMIAQGPDDTTTNTFKFRVEADDTMILNPVIASYDDAGDTFYLEKCPRLQLPAGLSYAYGDWFPDESTAQTEMDSDRVSNCLGYATDFPSANDFEATFVADALFMIASSAPSIGCNLFASINGEVGETFSIDYDTVTTGLGDFPTGPQFFILRYHLLNDLGTEIDFQFVTFGTPLTTTESGTFTSITLPYTGKYTINFDVFHLLGVTVDPTFTANFTTTSTGEITVNPVQALYDKDELDCPARIECS